MKDRVYAIVHKTDKRAYIGRTYRGLNERWAEHLRAAADGRTHKTLSEALRHEPDGWDILECEYSETASEAEWLERFRADGYELLNDTGANRAKPKQRDTSKEREWRELNANAERALDGHSEPVKDPQHAAKLLASAGIDLTRPAKRWEAANPEYFAAMRAEVERMKAVRERC